MRVAINGFGRIGRAVFRVIAGSREDMKVVGINDIAEDHSLAYLLKYDSVMGTFNGNVSLEDGYLVGGDQRACLVKERHPRDLAWKDLGVDVVIGVFGSCVRTF